jgi:hypothetical protein
MAIFNSYVKLPEGMISWAWVKVLVNLSGPKGRAGMSWSFLGI